MPTFSLLNCGQALTLAVDLNSKVSVNGLSFTWNVSVLTCEKKTLKSQLWDKIQASHKSHTILSWTFYSPLLEMKILFTISMDFAQDVLYTWLTAPNCSKLTSGFLNICMSDTCLFNYLSTISNICFCFLWEVHIQLIGDKIQWGIFI